MLASNAQLVTNARLAAVSAEPSYRCEVVSTATVAGLDELDALIAEVTTKALRAHRSSEELVSAAPTVVNLRNRTFELSRFAAHILLVWRSR